MSRGNIDAVTLPSKRVAATQGTAAAPGKNPKRRLSLSRTIGTDRVFISASQGPLILPLWELRALVEEVAVDE